MDCFQKIDNGIEAYLNLSYENAVNELSDKPDKVELIENQTCSWKRVHSRTRCISVDSFKNGIKIRCMEGRILQQ